MTTTGGRLEAPTTVISLRGVVWLTTKGAPAEVETVTLPSAAVDVTRTGRGVDASPSLLEPVRLINAGGGLDVWTITSPLVMMELTKIGVGVEVVTIISPLVAV